MLHREVETIIKLEHGTTICVFEEAQYGMGYGYGGL